MSFYNTTATPFDLDKIDAIAKLSKIGMLDRKSAIALLGGDPREHKTVVTRNAEVNPVSKAQVAHERRQRTAKARKVVRRDVKIPVHTVKNADERETLRGRMMDNTAGSITDAQIARITGKFAVADIVSAAQKLGFHGKSLRTLSMADASDLFTTLKA